MPAKRSKIFEILYGEGISRLGELIDMGVENGIVDKAGAWYSYGGERIGQGKENSRTYLREHPEIANEIESKLREKLLPSLDELKQEAEETDEVEVTEA